MEESGQAEEVVVIMSQNVVGRKVSQGYMDHHRSRYDPLFLAFHGGLSLGPSSIYEP